MICPNCEYEYVEGIELCPDCGEKLITLEEFEGNLLNPKDWVIVYTCSEEYEAEMLKTNLESAGIEALVWSQKDRNFPAAGDLSIIKLFVKKKDTEEAVAIIEDINTKQPDIEEETEE